MNWLWKWLSRKVHGGLVHQVTPRSESLASEVEGLHSLVLAHIAATSAERLGKEAMAPPPLSPFINYCPKCQSGQGHLSHTYYPKAKGKDEHLGVRCTRCGYTFKVLTSDAFSAPPLAFR